MKKLLLLSSVRENSSRLPKKMIRPFGETSLFELLLGKFKEISNTTNPFDNIAISVNRNDKRLWHLATSSGLEIIERDNNSIRKGNLKLSEVHNYLINRKETHVMWVNASFPFLEPSTIIKAGNYFKNNESIKSMTVVKKRYNWFWDTVTSKPINNSDYRNVNTQYSPPIYESVHCFHIFNREFMLKNNAYWKLEYLDPFLYEVQDTKEYLDIDNELDFSVCEALWKAKLFR